MRPIFLLILLLGLAGCRDQSVSEPKNTGTMSAQITEKIYGQTPNGDTVRLFTLRSASGMEAQLMSYGAYLTALHVPDSSGATQNVVLGFDRLEQYLAPQPFFGATVGRYANRIAKGSFALNGKTYQLAVNNPPNHLHGGPTGFAYQNWMAEAISEPGGDQSVRFTLESPHGSEGYPGTVEIQVTYTLTTDNILRIDYQGDTDRPTILNLTNHSYFNLHDGGRTPIYDHLLQIEADSITPVDENLIPRADLMAVAGTPFDFRQARRIGAAIDSTEELRRLGGYDHNFVLRDFVSTNPDDGYKLFFRGGMAHDPKSGRSMEFYTTEPGVQLYTANFGAPITGRDGVEYPKNAAFCLETQKFPDTPNRPDFPSAEIAPGRPYASRTEYRFSW